MTIYVNTNEYEFAHGLKPRGHGHWFFHSAPGGIVFALHKHGDHYIQIGDATYGEAKKLAVRWARKMGHHEIWVCS